MPFRVRQLQVICFVLFVWMLPVATAQENSSAKAQTASSSKTNANNMRPHAAPIAGAEYSGMYSFLREGEFVQVTIEDHGRVTGFISRYGDQESDRGDFLDHFFKSGKLDGNQLTFTTDVVHGVSYEFKGTIERGGGKSRGEEGYYLLKGTLTENGVDESTKTSARSRDVSLKAFPQDVSADAPSR
jgi:hypothetical protein